MRHMGQTSRFLSGVLLLTLASFTFSTCGGIGSSDLAGGGTGGTGISTGSVTGFGSVVVNGVHFLTDNDVAPGFVTKKMFNGMDNSSRMDRDLLRVGMVVILHHGPNDNNAQEIEYRDNLQGPVAARIAGVDNTVTILGHTVVVDNAALFGSLNPGDVLEVSGFVDSSGRIRASYADMVHCSVMMMCPVTEFEIKGFVSGLSPFDFRLGPLPGGTGTAVTVSFAPALGAGLADGMYVQVVTKDTQPVSGVITATGIQKLTPRTEFPNKAMADLEGLVTTPSSGSGNVVSFAVEGKRVQTDDNTQFPVGTTAADIRPDVRMQVQGTENGGVLSAGKIIFR